jgi:hypothetical protein
MIGRPCRWAGAGHMARREERYARPRRQSSAEPGTVRVAGCGRWMSSKDGVRWPPLSWNCSFFCDYVLRTRARITMDAHPRLLTGPAAVNDSSKGHGEAKQPRNSWPNEAAGPDGRALASPALFFFPLTMPEVSLESFACLLGFLSCRFFSRLVITFLSDFRPCFCGTQSGIWTKKRPELTMAKTKKKSKEPVPRGRRDETKKTTMRS